MDTELDADIPVGLRLTEAGPCGWMSAAGWQTQSAFVYADRSENDENWNKVRQRTMHTLIHIQVNIRR